MTGIEDWLGFRMEAQSYLDLFPPKEKLVYLTSDSTTTLEAWDRSATYIIGGIVDRNRLKGATMRKAEVRVRSTWGACPLCGWVDGGNGSSLVLTSQQSLCGPHAKQRQGIATARFPLQEHVQLSTSPVLTVNHVFSILLEYQRSGDWLQSFMKVLPQRKRLSFKTASGPQQEQQQEEEHEVDGAALSAATHDTDREEEN